MKAFIIWGLRISIVLYAVIHFFISFIEIDIFQYVLFILGLSTFIFSFFYITAAKFKLPLFIFLSGILVLIFSGYSLFDGLFHGLLLMRDMVGLLVVVPLISWILREEPYIEDIMSMFYKLINTSRKFYFGLAAFTQIIAYFLLFGSIPMMYQFVSIILKDQNTEVWENFKGTALLRGFAVSTMWVVSIPSFIFAVETLNASLWVSILQGFGIAAIGTVIAVIFSRFQEKKYGVNLTPILQESIQKSLINASPKHVIKEKVIEFFLLFITLFGTIFVIHGVFHVKLMLLIPIVIIFWMIAFFLYKKRGHKLLTVAKSYVETDLINQAYQLNVMLTVGVLIYGLRQTNFANTVVNSLNWIEMHAPLINPLFLLPFIVIILGFFGLGPLTVMVLVAGILSSLNLPYPPELVVLAVTSGSVISILISPLIMPVIVLSASNGLPLLKNGIKFNWKYAIVFYVVVQLYLQIMMHVW